MCLNQCVRMMTRMFVHCMLVCSAADALVVAAGCCWNIRVHFAAARDANKLCNVGLLSSYFQCFNYTVLPIYTISFIDVAFLLYCSSTDAKHFNCAFCDTSMTFCTNLV